MLAYADIVFTSVFTAEIVLKVITGRNIVNPDASLQVMNGLIMKIMCYTYSKNFFL